MRGGKLLEVDCLLHCLPDSDVGVPGLCVPPKHDPVTAATGHLPLEVGFLRGQGLLLVGTDLVVARHAAHLVDLPGAQRRDGGSELRNIEDGELVGIGQLKALRREQLVGTPVVGIPHITLGAAFNALSGDPWTGANLSFPPIQRAELLDRLTGDDVLFVRIYEQIVQQIDVWWALDHHRVPVAGLHGGDGVDVRPHGGKPIAFHTGAVVTL